MQPWSQVSNTQCTISHCYLKAIEIMLHERKLTNIAKYHCHGHVQFGLKHNTNIRTAKSLIMMAMWKISNYLRVLMS